ncbi:MAG: nuclear transport factor 2 family protein [Gammaproteobacteria bacterium]|nr:nuclear transport factor 2 family protein [Gammaproteobacteria bacterium]
MSINLHKDTINDLQMRYIRALDEKNMSAWLDSFEESATSNYRCISRENFENGLELSFMLDDSYNRLKDRVSYIDEIWKGTYQDYWTRHFTQCLSIEACNDSANTFDVTSNLQILYTPDDTRSTEVLVSGVYKDKVLVKGDTARFVSKQAILDTTVLPRYLVYPV